MKEDARRLSLVRKASSLGDVHGVSEVHSKRPPKCQRLSMCSGVKDLDERPC